MNPLLRRMFSMLGIVAILFGSLTAATLAQTVQAADTPDPTSVTIAGSLQSELGCGGDWDPACAATHLAYDADDLAWQATWTVPAGNWEYKAALNNSWDENYGANAAFNGDNIALSLGAATPVKFYYDHETHWVTSNRNAVIATAAGSFQAALGCPGDWQPDCLRSWLKDPDGDGTYTFSTTTIPAGNYEAKVTINESWDENYGAGGAPGGNNIPFTVAADGSTVTFSYDAISHVLSISVEGPAGHFPDNNVAWDGLRHDSRDPLYRTPGGAVPAGTPVMLRLRTFHNDVTGANLRLYDLDANGQSFLPMQLAARDVSCYQAGLEAERCDFWQVTLPNDLPNNYWYRFTVTDGSDTDFYGDNTAALDGGLGAVSDDAVDNSYALMVYDPAFTSPEWAQGAFIYQIFPDRFRSGRADNDAKTGDIRYDDPAIKLPWGTLPEGYCRNYADGATNCPWRFDDTPPAYSPDKEQPRGRDYYGGDLKGVDQYLDYLLALGVDTIYFNPIFDAASNHSYDTQDYYQIDPYFGTQKDWENLVKHAQQRGMNIVLDGVFNHLSSDSAFFDRYGHFTTVGACESLDSPYRDWFYFQDVTAGAGTCVGTAGPNSATYDGWFGFDSIPVINKSLPEVQQYFLTDTNSVSRYWLNQGAAGWRMDVMGDASFPAGYWETFRGVVKDTKSDALIISETWQKDSTLLRMLRGDRADTTMNYRLRDAVIGFLAPGSFDSKGFADSGRVISATEFGERLSAIREDYPDAAYYSLMNLLDSHDTERLLWTLTPGAETTAEKEMNAANLAQGKQRVRLASLIQFTVPGSPTVFYGDEVGITGDDDPDDRRTYPWTDKGGTIDNAMLAHYQTLAQIRKANPVLVNGDFNMLLTDNAAGVVAYGRKLGDSAALVAVNRSAETRTVSVPVAGTLPDGVTFSKVYGVGNAAFASAVVAGGAVELTLEANSALVLVASHDLTPTQAPTGLMVTGEGDGSVDLAWDAVSGAAGYNVYRSVVSGGGYVLANTAPLTGTTFSDSGLTNGQLYYYVVRALDAAGNASAPSNEAQALPHLTIGWANTQWPPTMTHTISATDRTDTVYGQVWIDGASQTPGATPSLTAQLGYGPEGSNPDGSPDWTWVDAVFNVQVGNNDEFMASLLPEAVGTYDYLYRYSTTGGRDWLYADLNGPVAEGSLPPNPGKLTVNASGDTTAPPVPSGLMVVSASMAGIELAWDAVEGDPSLYGYEVLRSDTPGGPYVRIAMVTGPEYHDTDVVQEGTYYYVVRSVDTSFNRSGSSAEVSGTAAPRTVAVTFNVTVPDTTDATGRSVHIAGSLARLDGGLPDWDPSGVELTRVDATHWTITLSGREATEIAYKYTLGDWEHVEKGAACDELSDRRITLSYGTNGEQVVSDTVLNWRNVAPCGN